MNLRAAVELGETIGAILWPALFVLGGVLWARHLNKNREFGNSVRWPIFVGLSVAVLMMLGQCSSRAARDDRVETKVLDDGPSNENVTQISSDGLRQLEFGATDQASKMFQDTRRPKISSSAQVTVADRADVIRIDTTIDGVVRMVRYLGVVEGRQKEVVCAAMGSESSAETMRGSCLGRAQVTFVPLPPK
ncbi:MAG: hypothetical protein ABL912_10880 [Novosphingobium sp.]